MGLLSNSQQQLEVLVSVRNIDFIIKKYISELQLNFNKIQQYVVLMIKYNNTIFNCNKLLITYIKCSKCPQWTSV